jgi:predicted RNase H-like nuclease
MGHVGVDGCHGGWVAVTRCGESLDYRVFDTIRALIVAYGNAELMLIDVPIGLPWKDAPVRPCDVLARRVLGHPRRSSVFPPPCREATHAPTPMEAREANLDVLQRALTKQTLAIREKIAEVDSVVLTDRRAASCIREVHPEICFWSLAGHRSMRYKKSTAEGRRERLLTLNRYEPSSSRLLDRALSETRRAQLQADDVLDALVALITAEVPPGELRVLRGEPDRDQCGLTMEMAYREIS